MQSFVADAPIRWGILGTGAIAAAFATDLALLADAELVAVGSRTLRSAVAFADRFAIPHRHGSYPALVGDEDVDVVYVATPHPAHRDSALLAIKAGKAVLVEKPFTLNAAEARDLVAAARARGTFLMEAMWTRFLPHVVRVRELLAAGRLGAVRSFMADFGGQAPSDATHRAWALDLGGGALLDLGIYPLSFASMLFGTPSSISAVSDPAVTGVDAQTAVVLTYGDGELAVVFTTLETPTACRACISGTDARIEIEGEFFAPTRFRIIDRTGPEEIYEVAHEGRGLRHQAAEVGRCLRAGLVESAAMPLAETVSIMESMDEIRRQIGLVYPSERVDSTS
jgi:predicted dehydrogenase